MKFRIKSSFLKSFMIYGLGAGMSKFISLLLIPIYVRVFNTSEYGVVDIIQTCVMITTILGLLQLETSVQRYYYEYKVCLRKKMISTVLITIFIMSFTFFLISVFFADTISFLLFDEKKYSKSIMLAFATIPFVNLSGVNFIILRYMKKKITFVVVTLLQVLLTSIITIFCIVHLNLGVPGIFIGQLLGFIVVVIIQLYHVRENLEMIWSWKLLKRMFDFSLPQFPARIGSASTSYLNRFLMLYFLTTSVIGVYAVAFKFSSMMQLFTTAFTMTWFPFMYETLKKKNHREVFGNIYDVVLIVVMLLVIVTSLFSREIIQLFTIEEYYNAQFLLPGLIFYNGLFIIKSVVDLGAMITKKTKYISYVYIFIALMNIIFVYSGIIMFREKGVVYALVFTNFLLILISYFVSERLYPIGMQIMKFVVMFSITLFFVVVLMNYEIDFIYRFLFCIILFCTVFYVFRNKKNLRYV